MIKHHPKNELLHVFVKGELPASLSAAIAIHADMCPACQQKISEFTDEQVASFQNNHYQNFMIANKGDYSVAGLNPLDMNTMINSIVADDKLSSLPEKKTKTINIADNEFTLPTALQNMELGGFIQLGKLARARLKLDEGDIHSNLLHIQPGGSVPEHTHKGYELTLLLSGEFSDEQGHYVPGDFIMLDSKHTHKPKSEHGCLCFTVSNNSLHFTQGINRLLNPIGAFVY